MTWIKQDEEEVLNKRKTICGKMGLVKGAIMKFVAFLRKWKNHQVSIVFFIFFFKKGYFLGNFISILVSNGRRLLFMDNLIKYYLKTIATDEYFIFYNSLFPRH